MGYGTCAKGCMVIKVPKSYVVRVKDKISKHKRLRRKKNALTLAGMEALEMWLKKKHR